MMNKKTVKIGLSILLLAGTLSSVFALKTDWGDSLLNGTREVSDTDVFSPARYAFDNNSETYWSVKEGASYGWFERYWDEQKDFSSISVEAYISKGTTLTFSYEKDGTWIPYEYGIISGPVDGSVQILLSDEVRRTSRILAELNGNDADECRIYEVSYRERINSKQWGKILPEKYSFNLEEYISIKADRLWNGYIDDAWYEPLWYTPWEIQQSPEGNTESDIFAPYNGNPDQAGEIIWDLDGEYRIDLIKAYMEQGWRNIAFDFWNGTEWSDRKEFKNSMQTGWNRIEAGNTVTSRIRITFPAGWEYARFISEIEIWGEGEHKNNSYSIKAVKDAAGNKYRTSISSDNRNFNCLEIITDGASEIEAEINGNRYVMDKPFSKTKGRSTFRTKINADDLRNGTQFIVIDSKTYTVEDVIVRNENDDGRITLGNSYSDGYKGFDEYETDKVELKLERRYEIEKIRIFKDGESSICVNTDEGYAPDKYLEYKDGYWEITPEGLISESLRFETNYKEKISEIEVYGSPLEDNGIAYELWNGKEIGKNSCIIGWIGNSHTKILIDGKYDPRKQDHIYWYPVSACGKEYLENCEHKISVELNDLKSERKYQNHNPEDIENYRKSLNGSPIILTVDLPHGDIYTQNDIITVSGTVSNTDDVKVDVNGLEAEIRMNSYCIDYQIEEGSNILTVIARDNFERSIQKTINVIKDSECPEITIITPAENEYINTGCAVFLVDGNKDKDLWWKFNDEEWEGEYGQYKIKNYYLDDGYYTYTVWASDRAGNISDAESVDFCMDVTPPENLQLWMNIDGWSNNNTPTAQFSAEDRTAGIDYFEYRIDDNEWKRCESPLELETLEDGIRTLEVRVFDKARNVTETSKKLYIDTSIPPLPENERPVPTENNIVYKWTGIDDGEEFRSYGLERNPSWKDGSIRILDRYGYGDLRYEDVEAEKETAYSYRIWSIDRAGNASEKTEWKKVTAGIAIEEINTEGDTVAEFDGLTLTLPKGAAAEDIIKILINEISEDYISEKPVNPMIGGIYTVSVMRQTESGTVITNHADLNDYAVLEMSFNPAEIPEGYNKEDIGVFYYDDIWGSWLKMEDVYFDFGKHRVFAKTDHFTDFSIQATKKVVLSEQEVREGAYSLKSNTVGHDELRISCESGGASLRFTEFNIPGKNDLNLSVQRIYSTSASLEDGSIDPEKDDADIDGEKVWKIADGWRINMPYMKWEGENMFISGADGNVLSLASMDDVNGSDDGYTVTMESHEYSDMKVELKFDKKDHYLFGFISFITVSTSKEFSEAILYQPDGRIVHFGKDGRVTKITDCTGKNSITFTYDKSKITVVDTLGNNVVFNISDGLISSIENGKDLKVIYNKRNFEKTDDIKRKSTILMSATDIGGRVWNYEYTEYILENHTSMKEPYPGFREEDPIKNRILALSGMEGNGIGYTSIGYAVTKDLEYDDIIKSNDKEYKYQIYQDKLSEISKTVYLTKNGQFLNNTEYEILFNIEPENKQVYVSKSSVDDGKLKTFIYSEVVLKDKYKLSNAPEAIKRTSKYDASVERNRIIKQRVLTYSPVTETKIGDILQYTQAEELNSKLMRPSLIVKKYNDGNKEEILYTYDEKTGNVIQETKTDITGGRESGTTVTKEYTAGIANRPNLPSKITTKAYGKIGDNEVSNTVNESFTYNASGQILTYTKGTGISRYTYDDKYGQVKTVTSPGNSITEYTYSYDDKNTYTRTVITKDVVTSSSKKEDLIETYVIDKKSGNTVNYIDARNYVTENAYDALSRIVSQKKGSEAAVVTAVYDDANNKVTVTDELGCEIEYVYDNNGRLLEINKKGDDKTISQFLKYDGYGRVTKMSEPVEKTASLNIAELPGTLYEYDRYDRPIKITDADGYITKYEYDDSTRITTETKVHETSNSETVFERKTIQKDFQGNVIYEKRNEKDPYKDTVLSEIYRYYDGEGKEIRSIDGNETVTDIRYNSINQKESVVIAGDISVQKYEYNNDGFVTRLTTSGKDMDDVIVDYKVNALGKAYETRTEAEKGKKTILVLSSYDKNGNCIEEKTSYEGDNKDVRTLSYTYNWDNKILTQTDGNGYVTTNTYDAKGNLTSLTDPRQNIKDEEGKYKYSSDFYVQMEYDKFGRLVKAWIPKEDVRRTITSETQADIVMEYDAQGNLKQRIDPENIVTVYEYTPAGRVSKETKGELVTEYTYDEIGREHQITYPDGTVTIYTYDQAGRKVKALNAADDYVGERYVYDGNNNVIEITDRNGNVTSYEYNELNLVIQELHKDQTGTEVSRIEFTYDGSGRKLSEMDAQKNLRTYSYDNAGRLLSEKVNTAPEELEQTYEYDARGNIIKYTDAEGNCFKRQYTKTDVISEEYAYKKDAATASEERHYVYDEAGELESVTDGKNKVSYNLKKGSYDASPYGNIRSVKWNTTGLEMKYAYDDMNRITAITTPGNKTVSYTYDASSRINTVSDFISGNISYKGQKVDSYTTSGPGITRETTYNTVGLPEEHKFSMDSVLSGYSYNYDKNNNVVSRTSFKTNQEDIYEYDSQNRLVNSKIKGHFQNKIWEELKEDQFSEIERDLSCRKNPSSVISDIPGTLVLDSKGKSFVYNFERSVSTSRIELYPESKAHRVTEHDISLYLKNEQNDEWTEITKDNWKLSKDENNGSLHIEFISAYEMRYLKIHNNWDDRDFMNVSHDRYATFKGSLKSMIRVWTYELGLDEVYKYDSNSNRISLNGTEYRYFKNSEGLNTARVMYDGEWYYEYDLRGNRVKKGREAEENDNTVTIKTDDEYWVYTWDLHNRLVRVQQYNAPDSSSCVDVAYEYDPNNYRIRRTSVLQNSVTEYAYDNNGSVTYQKETVGNNVTTRSYAYFDGKIIGFYINDERYYTVTDMLGTVVDVYAEDGTEVWSMDYTSFGMKGGETVEKIQFEAMFTGKDMDPETDLTYHWNRWRSEEGYNWISEDSARDGTNWYGYAGQNPVIYLDPNGLEQVYFIYTYKNTEYDQKMKSHERNSINDDISRLESKGVSVKVLESATKKDILNAISDNEARIIITSGHGYTNNDGIQTSDSDSFSPLDLKGQPIGDSLNTVIFENCFQGDMETEWENAFGNNIDVVGWKGKTNTFETISFNGIGIFDRQESNLKDYLENSVVTNEVDTISSAAPVIDKKGK